MKRALIAGILGGAAMIATACTSGPLSVGRDGTQSSASSTCASDGDCSNGDQCVKGQCCDANGNCGGTPGGGGGGGGGGTACKSNAECNGGQCVNGTCI
jgi:hypothetical protein